LKPPLPSGERGERASSERPRAEANHCHRTPSPNPLPPVRGSQDVHVRRTSRLLEAQKQPAAVPLALGAIGLTLLSQLAEQADAARWRMRRR